MHKAVEDALQGKQGALGKVMQILAEREQIRHQRRAQSVVRPVSRMIFEDTPDETYRALELLGVVQHGKLGSLSR